MKKQGMTDSPFREAGETGSLGFLPRMQVSYHMTRTKFNTGQVTTDVTVD